MPGPTALEQRKHIRGAPPSMRKDRMIDNVRWFCPFGEWKHVHGARYFRVEGSISLTGRVAHIFPEGDKLYRWDAEGYNGNLSIKNETLENIGDAIGEMDQTIFRACRLLAINSPFRFIKEHSQ